MRLKNCVTSFISAMAALSSVSQAAPSQERLASLVKAVDVCAANGVTTVRRYKVDSFNQEAALQQLKRQDVQIYGRECVEGRAYSKSKINGMFLFKSMIFKDAYINNCLQKNLTSTQFTDLVNLIDDPSNKGVIASVYTDAIDNTEACLYHNFVVFRADGLSVSFSFDYRD